MILRVGGLALPVKAPNLRINATIAHKKRRLEETSLSFFLPPYCLLAAALEAVGRPWKRAFKSS